MSARGTQMIVAELLERMEALEQRLGAVEGTNGFSARRLGLVEPQPHWLAGARFASRCQGGCGERVEQGERAWYEPGKGVWHEACAPAEARQP